MLILKEKLKERGVTATMLAERLGASYVYACALIRSKNPTVKSLQRISEVTGIHITEFFAESRDNSPKCPHCGSKMSIEIKA